MRHLAIALVAVSACGSPQPRELPHFGVPFATGPIDPVGSGSSIATAEPDDFHFILPPGCSDADSRARVAEIDAISDEVANGSADPRAITLELIGELAKPCLTYIAGPARPPASTTREHLHDAFFQEGYGDALAQAAAGIRAKGDLRAIVIPPEIVPDLAGSDAAAVAPMLCAGSDASCARSLSYVVRAEHAFDQRARAEVEAVLPVEACDGSRLQEDDEIKWPHTLDDFASCAGEETTRNWRFATTNLRPPEHGWLVLRGRRGHYDWADELRAYDLATGAAYVARHTGQIVVDNGKPHGDDAFVGRVAPDQLRELAFVLLARRAIVPVRTRTIKAAVPANIPNTLSSRASGDPHPVWLHATWGSDAQTEIAFTYLDGATRIAGTFTYPDSADWRDDYVDELLEVVEAGLVRDCAPAKLPPASTLIGPAGAVSQIDASRAEQDATDHALDAILDTVRSKACRGAK